MECKRLRPGTPHRVRAIAAATLVSSVLGAAFSIVHGCGQTTGCMGGDDGSCVPASACPALSYACEVPFLELRLLSAPSDRPSGMDALGARGDIVVGNDRFVAVIDAIDEPHYLAPSGGALLDMAPRHGADDQLNLAFQAVGILPHDAVRYHTVELRDESPALVAVIVRGRLDLRPDIEVVTRYEARPCEPGLRIRTEVFHGGRDPITMLLSDGFFWGDREVTPFLPVAGRGFRHPELDLEELGQAFVDTPFVAAQSHGEQSVGYAVVPCDRALLSGFHNETLSAVGAPRRIVIPGDSIAFERFVLVDAGPGLQRVVTAALDARFQLFEEPYVHLTGSVRSPTGEPVGGDERMVSLFVTSSSRPIGQAVPAEDGRFDLAVPASGKFKVQAHVLGRPVGDATEVDVEGGSRDLGVLVVPVPGRLRVKTSDEDGAPVMAELAVVPRGCTRAQDVAGDIHGAFSLSRCAPYLGPPYGGSPACNRALVGPDGETSFAVTSGTYWVLATHGPFWTLAIAPVEVRDGQPTDVALQLSPLDLVPPGVLSADFHVHAGASFDASMPETDRVMSVVSAGLDVIVATDHEVITSYDHVLDALDLADRLHVIPGMESTGHILFLEPPGADVPRAIGHFNFWPVFYDPMAARKGAPDDERLEPGALFDRVRSRMPSGGVAQLNHPFGEESLGRDTGYLTAVDWDPRTRLPATDDGSNAGQLVLQSGAGTRNIDYDVQEVMNGHSFSQYLRYREAWFAFLNQGELRAGTANSDTHALSVEMPGWPRNLVFGNHVLADFDEQSFLEDVRRGRMVGTNGPVIVACLDDVDGVCQPPSLSSLVPLEAGSLSIDVSAAPWIAVEEVRVVVNGNVRRVISSEALAHPSDPLGHTGTKRWAGRLPTSELLADLSSSQDAWIVVEAGAPLPPFRDSDDNGLPDGVDDGVHADPPCAGCGQEVESCEFEAAWLVDVIAPSTHPTAFTNPFVVDRLGDGWRGVRE